MGKFPFTIRPIRLDEAIVRTEPVSLPNDLSGKVTLSSKYASVYLSELAETLQKKDIAKILLSKGEEEVILSTNTILSLSRADALNAEEEKKKYWPIPVLVGFLVGIVIIFFFRKDFPFYLVLLVISSTFFGVLVGFVLQKFYEARVKKLFYDWAKEILDD
jgi:uncharacterized membrane protein